MEKVIADGVKSGVKAVDAFMKKAWSIMDAASEKKAPSEYLSQQGIKAIQGIQGAGS